MQVKESEGKRREAVKKRKEGDCTVKVVVVKN